MTLLQQLLLLPLLAPLVLVLVLAAANPKPPVALRMLVWSSPALPLGAWMAAAATAGAGLSAAATGLALQQSKGGQATIRPGRQSRRRPWTEGEAPPPAGPRPGPSRPPGEPSPTVEVPFRVIRKARPPASAAAATVASEPQGSAKAVGDGWDQPLSSDWD